jgi:hypothetical protein
MKYVMFSGNEFVLIPEFQSHKQFKDFSPISAGFCRIESYRNQYNDIMYKVSCWGKSDTLN